MIGVSKLPFEPRGERLLEFSRFLKNLKFDPEYSQTWDVDDEKATLRLRFPHSGKIKLYDDYYKIDMLSYPISIPEAYANKKVRKMKTESGATYTFK